MFESIDIMKTLDLIRANHKIKIQDLVQGIMSRKTYTRLLNDEASISFYDLNKLLEKLSIPFLEFSLYVVNSIEGQFPMESSFFLTILRENYQKAYDEFYPGVIGKELKTIFGAKSVPATIELMLYKLNKQSKEVSLSNLHQKFDLKSILESRIIDDGISGILYSFVYLVGDSERRQIGNFIYKVIFDPSFRHYYSYTEISKTIIHVTGILSFTLLDKLDDEELNRLEKIVVGALDYHTKFRGTVFDHKIFRILYQFQKEKNLENDFIIFSYISSYLSVFEKGAIPHKLDVTKEDMIIFKNYLKKGLYQQNTMYEGMLKHGKIW